MIDPMTPELATRLLIALSLCFGIAVAILGVLDSPAIGLVAAIGAIVLGGLWALRGAFFGRRAGR
jgi:uncharacterized membrane protein